MTKNPKPITNPKTELEKIDTVDKSYHRMANSDDHRYPRRVDWDSAKT